MTTTRTRRKLHARSLLRGKGILAADETVRTVTKRLDAMASSRHADSRRAYRELFFTHDGYRPVHQRRHPARRDDPPADAHGVPFPELLAQQGIVPGIKVDDGAKPLAGAPGNTSRRGSTGCATLEEYRALGARFAKWRAVIDISDTLPSPRVRASRTRTRWRGMPRSARNRASCRSSSPSPDGRRAHHRALRGGDGRRAARGLRRAARSERVASRACCSSRTW